MTAVTFRRVEKRDMPALRLTDKAWKRILERRKWGSGSHDLPSRVVTIDGQIVLAFAGDNQVFFQDDRFPIAEIVRADLRVWQALAVFDRYALQELKRERSGKPDPFETLRRLARDAR